MTFLEDNNTYKQWYVHKVTDQAPDDLHKFFKQHSNVLVAQNFKQCVKVRLSNEMLVNWVDFCEKRIQFLQKEQHVKNKLHSLI